MVYVSKPVWHMPLLCVQWKTPDDAQRNFPKYVKFYSKNKLEKLVRLVGFVIRIYISKFHLHPMLYLFLSFPNDGFADGSFLNIL